VLKELFYARTAVQEEQEEEGETYAFESFEHKVRFVGFTSYGVLYLITSHSLREFLELPTIDCLIKDQ